jgi:tetratricopeptide (TPR) repeat protein
MKAMPHIKGGVYDFASLNKAVSINPIRQIPYRAFMKCIFSKDYYGALFDLDSAEQLVNGGGIMDHSFLFYKGLCYLSIGKADSAVTYLQKDVAAQSKRMGLGNEHYNSLFYLGLAHLYTHQTKQAERYLLASIKSYSKFPEPNFYLGILYLQKNEKIKAKKYFEIAQLALSNGYNMNEDNNIYVDYPFQISAIEIEQVLKE